MKTRFLNIKNCHELLPKIGNLKLLERLEVCLEGINNSSGILNGSIDKLIKRNESTQSKSTGSNRLISSPIEIAQHAIYEQGLVNTQAVEKRFPGPALFHTYLGYENGMAHKTIVPLQFLIKGWGDASNGYQCYVHTISNKIERVMTDTDNYYYVGITGRNWLQRLDEHIREMRQGNRRLFYRAWRERYGMADVLFTSYLRNVNLSFEDAMNWEEKTVDRMASDKYGLNMIPGGFKGLQYLHKLRITENTNITLEERDRAIAEYARRNPRKGLPNPFISELWKDDDFYVKNISAKKNTLSEEQVRRIRELNQQGWSVTKIKEDVGATNELQVKNVIKGRYYKRYQ